MANLRNFLWNGSHDGMPVDIYLNRTPRIGSGVLQVAQPLRVKLEAQVTVFGQTYGGNVEILMPDQAGNGTCTVILNGARHDDCQYHVDGHYLYIHVADRELQLGGAGDKQWTWLKVSGVPAWIGVWPGSHAMSADEAERELEAIPG